MKEPIMKLVDLGFCYERDHMVIEHLHAEVFEEERIAVLGANGAGKSTLFLNMNGVREPSCGKIYYRGEEITKKNRKQLSQKVGIVFQDADSQIIGATVKQEVAFGPANMRLSREQVEEQTMRAISAMGLEKLTHRPPHYLSGGEKKKVSIADILAMEPEVVIFDEPTAALDPVNVEILEQTLFRMKGEKKTVLLSTHDVDFAYRFADRIWVLHGGKFIGDGRPDEIFRDQELLKQANLKQPYCMKVYDLLRRNGLILENEKCPRTLEDLGRMLEKSKSV